MLVSFRWRHYPAVEIPEGAMTAKSQAKLKPRGPGRLSTEETALLENRLLDAAEAVFLEQVGQRAKQSTRAMPTRRRFLTPRFAGCSMPA
jgi:hypothetical protein